jgi:hypothetical protein
VAADAKAAEYGQEAGEAVEAVRDTMRAAKRTRKSTRKVIRRGATDRVAMDALMRAATSASAAETAARFVFYAVHDATQMAQLAADAWRTVTDGYNTTTDLNTVSAAIDEQIRADLHAGDAQESETYAANVLAKATAAKKAAIDAVNRKRGMSVLRTIR